MYAIIKTGGKQYRVSEGDVITIEKLAVNEGEAVVFDEVLTIVNDDEVKIGKPFVEGAKVTAKVEAQTAIDAMTAEAATASRNQMIIIAAVLGTLLLGLIIFLVIKTRKKKKVENEQLLNTLIDDSIIPKEPETFDPIEFESKSQKSHLENEIKKYAMEKPEQVVEIIKSWMTENER